ncbi:hypothetical protein PtB15_15B150 [Puccinia triticina]|nr:hypothetical protein PtB15_15B150 [Puccinia triticina]
MNISSKLDNLSWYGLFVGRKLCGMTRCGEDDHLPLMFSKLRLEEDVAIDYIYTNFYDLGYCGPWTQARYMAKRSLFAVNRKAIRRINNTLMTRHPGPQVTLSALDLAPIPGFTMKTTRDLSTVTRMERPEINIHLKSSSGLKADDSW